MVLNPASRVPLYQQFKIALERRIAAGEWAPDSAIPTEFALIKEYEISRITVRKALDELMKEGRIYRRRGRGTFVAPPKIAQTLANLTGFAEELAIRGMAPKITILEHRLIPATPAVADALQLSAQAEVLHISRLVMVGAMPLFVDDSYFPEELAGILRLERLQVQPIYLLLEAAGRSPAMGEQRLEAISIPQELANHLGVQPGVPGLAIARVTKDHLGTPIEYTSIVYRGDRYHYTIQLQRH